MISIHAPREGSDLRPDLCHKEVYIFLSTLPVRGATNSQRLKEVKENISIHAPREGSDYIACMVAVFADGFLSTLPVRGATYYFTNNKKGN